MNIRKILKIVSLTIFSISIIMVLNHIFNDSDTPNRELIKDKKQVDNNNNLYIDSNEILPEYSNLYNENNDIVGWIFIEGTRINYPVMQSSENNEKYLHKDWNRKYSYAGLPFLDNRCSIYNNSNNLIIYGHNMVNRTMFSDLLKYKDENFYKLHSNIEFDTIFENRIYEIVGVFKSEVYNEFDNVFKYYYFFGYETENELNKYKKEINDKQLYNTGKSIHYGDELLTLSTCDEFGKNGRFVVVARRIS